MIIITKLGIGASVNFLLFDVKGVFVWGPGIQSIDVTEVIVPMVEELERVVPGLECDSLGNPINNKHSVFIGKEVHSIINGGKKL